MWGPLAEQPHAGAAGPGDPPWRENAFFSFWDDGGRAAAIVHVSTSPNAEGRRARASVALDGRTRELVEPLAPMELSSESIHVDLAEGLRVAASELALELHYTPRFVVADYTQLDGLLAPLGDAPPMRHYQQGGDVTGWIALDGDRVEVAGRGLRDRTWGFRDDQRSASAGRSNATITVEYLAGAACFDAFDVTLMKMLRADGQTHTGGFVLGATARRVEAADVTRDAAGLLAGLDVRVDDGEELALRALDGPRVGFWIPLGVARRGPALSAYDEFVVLDAGPHGAGGGVMEHGTVRRLC